MNSGLSERVAAAMCISTASRPSYRPLAPLLLNLAWLIAASHSHLSSLNAASASTVWSFARGLAGAGDGGAAADAVGDGGSGGGVGGLSQGACVVWCSMWHVARYRAFHVYWRCRCAMHY